MSYKYFWVKALKPECQDKTLIVEGMIVTIHMNNISRIQLGVNRMVIFKFATVDRPFYGRKSCLWAKRQLSP